MTDTATITRHILNTGLTLRNAQGDSIVIERYANGAGMVAKAGSCTSPVSKAAPLADAVRFLGRAGTVYACYIEGTRVEVSA